MGRCVQVTVTRKEICIKDIGAAGTKGILNTLLESEGVPVKTFGDAVVTAVVRGWSETGGGSCGLIGGSRSIYTII
jgi:hypothetical protein